MLLQSLRQLITLKASEGAKSGGDTMGGHLPTVMELLIGQCNADDEGVRSMVAECLGRLALMMSARYIQARVTTLATLTTPVLTLVLAFVLLSDWPQTHQLLGGAIMIAGISIPVLRLRQDPT